MLEFAIGISDFDGVDEEAQTAELSEIGLANVKIRLLRSESGAISLELRGTGPSSTPIRGSAGRKPIGVLATRWGERESNARSADGPRLFGVGQRAVLRANLS